MLRFLAYGAVLLAGQEALLRGLFPLPEISNFNRALYTTVSPRPMHAEWTTASASGEAAGDLSLNIYGFRDRRDWRLSAHPGRTRVAFAGGSFVEGVLVDDRETLPELYAREARRAGADVESMNLGMTGSDLGATLRVLRDVIALFSPREICLVLHPGNLSPPPFDPDWLESPIEPVFPKRWAPRAAHVAKRHIRGEVVPFRFWRKAVSFDSLLERVREEIEAGTYANAERAWLAADLTPVLSALERYTRRRSCELFVVYIPDVREAAPEASPSESGRAYAVAQVTSRLGIPFLDVTAELRREQSRGNRLYWNTDPHVRPRGYDVIARRLWEWRHRALAQVHAGLDLLPSQAAPRGLVPVESVFRTGYADIDRLQFFFQPTLEANKKDFRGRSGKASGFGAGTTYPQIWLRDSATILPAARYFYDVEPLRSWIEEHLASQQSDGQLEDWIAAGPAAAFSEWAPRVKEIHRQGEIVLSADKNTTATDQEASAVLSAHRLFEITGDRAWLRRKILGRSVLDRCDKALEFVLRHRIDSETGMVTSALTADWGDVSPVYPDQRAIYMDDKTPRGVGLYTNAIVYKAARRLGDLWAAVGNSRRAAYWRERAEALQEHINAHLWQDGRGFYAMHLPVGARRAERLEDDADVFALGGHAVALLARVPDEKQAERVFHAEEERRRRFSLTMPGVTLLPPYKNGVFLHPALSRSWRYQNGGHWDWFAGRFVLAEFEWGRSERALKDLERLATAIIKSGAFHEWRSRDGAGHGSRHYAGGAAVMADAVFRGLFGVTLTADRLDLRVRLGIRDAAIYLRQPADQRFVAYRTDYDRINRVLRMRYESSLPGNGTLAILLPPDARVEAVRRDGEGYPFTLVTAGEDIFVSLSTDWRPHSIEISFGPERR
ncbi:MAG: hypothetical protein JXO72_11210 [Vicinamibacteria bacterium]|nr:hypothetical protein [Vicinamibacteria bacterium]